MSHRKPTKTQFIDLWRDEATCASVSIVDPSMQSAWDNIDVGTWEKTTTEPDPRADIAKVLCFECPVREFCVRDALKDNEAEGLRGGYRFENGTATRQDARKIFNEWGLRAKVSKKSRGVVVEDVQSEEVFEMSRDETSE